MDFIEKLNKKLDILTLVNDALEMLRDRSDVADIIYWAVRLDQEERVAILLAYGILKDEEKKND